MGSVCSSNDNDKLISQECIRRLRDVEKKIEELYYEKDVVETDIISDNEYE